MEPALGMTLLWLLFAGTHVGLATRRVRTALVDRWGEWGFRLLFTLVAAVLFTLLVRYYADHRLEGAPGLAAGNLAALRWPLMTLIVLGVALATGGLVAYPASPTALFADRVRPPRGLARVTRHPFFVGLALMALAHVLLAPRLVGTVFQGGFALLALAGAWHQDRKLLAQRGAAYKEYLASTSIVPFGAVLAGRQRLVWGELPLTALGAGLALAFALRFVHASLFANGGAWLVGVVLGVAGLATLQSWRHARRGDVLRGGAVGAPRGVVRP